MSFVFFDTHFCCRMHVKITKLANKWCSPTMFLTPLDSKHMVSKMFSKSQVFDGWLRFQLISTNKIYLQILTENMRIIIVSGLFTFDFETLLKKSCIRIVSSFEQFPPFNSFRGNYSIYVVKKLPYCGNYSRVQKSIEKLVCMQ